MLVYNKSGIRFRIYADNWIDKIDQEYAMDKLAEYIEGLDCNDYEACLLIWNQADKILGQVFKSYPDGWPSSGHTLTAFVQDLAI